MSVVDGYAYAKDLLTWFLYSDVSFLVDNELAGGSTEADNPITKKLQCLRKCPKPRSDRTCSVLA